ncbi:MAG: spherulation-specific family 4 protein [Prevotella salivae]|uniref:spherulation-specific family 4 protein n=1 Tax=Segatella salivae TaxID=228604 RepID=UPI001CB40B7C|nr:spherulation-specific family 4 protein [Segatella salivae]MBF1543598.1 spherulation-specific family 4 protein [Segatella salivae]
MRKTIKHEFNINPQKKDRAELDVKLYSEDHLNSSFEFTFNDEAGAKIALDETYKVEVMAVFRDTNRTVYSRAEIADGKAIYKFDTTLIDNDRTDYVDVYVYLKHEDMIADTGAFSFKVVRSAIDAKISDIKKYYIENLDGVQKEYLAKFEEAKKAYEAKMQEHIDHLPSAEELRGPSGKVRVGNVSVAETPEEVGITNSGTETEAVLDFKLPKGEKGDKGDGLELDYSFRSIQEMRDKKDTLKEGDTVIINAYGTPDNGKIYRVIKGELKEFATIRGERGDRGIQGEVGKGIYQYWLESGHVGTVNDMLQELRGPRGYRGDAGADAYEVWKSQGNTGTVADFLASLKGPKGRTPDFGVDDGYLTIDGGRTNHKIVGRDGRDGRDGVDGLTPQVGPNQTWVVGNRDTLIPVQGPQGFSAYDIDVQVNGYAGTKEEWLAELKSRNQTGGGGLSEADRGILDTANKVLKKSNWIEPSNPNMILVLMKSKKGKDLNANEAYSNFATAFWRGEEDTEEQYTYEYYEQANSSRKTFEVYREMGEPDTDFRLKFAPRLLNENDEVTDMDSLPTTVKFTVKRTTPNGHNISLDYFVKILVIDDTQLHTENNAQPVSDVTLEKVREEIAKYVRENTPAPSPAQPNPQPELDMDAINRKVEEVVQEKLKALPAPTGGSSEPDHLEFLRPVTISIIDETGGSTSTNALGEYNTIINLPNHKDYRIDIVGKKAEGGTLVDAQFQDFMSNEHDGLYSIMHDYNAEAFAEFYSTPDHTMFVEVTATHKVTGKVIKGYMEYVFLPKDNNVSSIEERLEHLRTNLDRRITDVSNQLNSVSGSADVTEKLAKVEKDKEFNKYALSNEQFFSPVTYYWADYYKNENSQWGKVLDLDHLGFTIINNANGAGAEKSTDFEKQVAIARSKGVKILGYVHTGYGQRDKTEILSDVRKHIEWYGVDGIFLDETISGWTAEQVALIPHYQELHDEIKKLNSRLFVVANPGTNTIEAVLPTADIFMTYESNANQYITAKDYKDRDIIITQPYYRTQPKARFWHVVYGVTPENYLKVMERAQKEHVGHVYFTDKMKEDNKKPDYSKAPSPYLLDVQEAWASGKSAYKSYLKTVDLEARLTKLIKELEQADHEGTEEHPQA